MPAGISIRKRRVSPSTEKLLSYGCFALLVEKSDNAIKERQNFMVLKRVNGSMLKQQYILLLSKLVTEWKKFCKNINGMGVYL